MSFIFWWISFGIICTMIASGKGLPPTPWFFWGILFGPFALILILTKPSLAAPPAQKGMKKCPFCAEDIKSAAVVCKHCKRDIPFEFHSMTNPPEIAEPKPRELQPTPDAAPQPSPVHHVQWSNIPDEEIKESKSQ